MGDSGSSPPTPRRDTSSPDSYKEQLYAEMAHLAQLSPRSQQAHIEPILMYFSKDHVPGKYKCRWCFQTVRCRISSTLNLQKHRDGSINRNGTIHPSCPARLDAIACGCQLPQAADANVNGE
ncbi:hypothetical protein MJO28_013386 [Puccinia striiformis f. sp. tritici]|uniref:Uncharacterized protein n=1 Tax=Puccinia striiformis f. sp. tritici TaxID=168172 RepID=A0ACC0DYL8_9BASI|nr:hypothetical protein MJO28_013386 [Puccinia striiformis f. sp. tritici]